MSTKKPYGRRTGFAVQCPRGAWGQGHPDEPGGTIRRDREAAARQARRLRRCRHAWITGRKKDLIISGGENVSPNEIEAALQEHPAVAEAAVIGVPDAARGEAPKAFVALRDGAATTAAELSAYLRERLPRFKVPAAWAFRAELPHSPTGKVLKRELRT